MRVVPSGLGRVLIVLAILLLAGMGLAHGPGREAALARLDRLAADLGLAVTQIGVTGLDRALPEDIFSALDAEANRSILAFDAEAARARLEALPWIKSATISRALPGQITIHLTERRPFAVWQNRQMFFLIDEDGHALEPVVPSDHPLLPMVAGAGAAEEAQRIVALVSRYPTLSSRLGAAVRVAGRRWTLKLKNGPDVMLSANDPEASIARLEALQKQHSILDRRLAVVDLRHSSMLVLRPAGGPG
jgi:cell division protein FtsQ